jgi:pantothenate kinase
MKTKNNFKKLKRNNWKEIQEINTQDVTLKSGTKLRILQNKKTGLIEIILDHNTLRNQNQTEDFQPIILVEGFYQD